jgi:hypothetical protein
MKKKKVAQPLITEQELRFLEQLRKHPKIKARVQSIVEPAAAQEGPLQTADQVEELLIEQVRLLGNATMSEWAIEAEKHVTAELEKKDPSVLSRKKNAEVVVCFWFGGGGGENLV